MPPALQCIPHRRVAVSGVQCTDLPQRCAAYRR